MTLSVVGHLLTVLAVLALVLGVSVPPASAAPMPEMTKAGHCGACPDESPMTPMKAMPCTGFACLGAAAVALPAPQSFQAEPFVVIAAYSIAPAPSLIGRTLRPEPLPPRQSVQA